MRVRPVSTAVLVDEVCSRIESTGTGRVRVVVDGPPPSEPGALADAVAERLRTRGRATLVVAAADFARPASLRLEHGRDDPDELLTAWLDEAALRREVLAPAAADGSGAVLPRLWDMVTDRAFRDPPVPLAPGGVLLLHGALLLGRGLPAELTVHLRVGAAALARRTPAQLRWSLPAYRRYDAEHDPGSADVLVFADDPRHLAVLDTR